MAEDEMIVWQHRLNGHEFKQTPGDSEGQGSLACCSPWLSSHGRGLGPRDAFKKDSRGLSHVAAGKPGFPRLGPVNSGSFSGCL